MGKRRRRSLRAAGTNPRALGTNPRVMKAALQEHERAAHYRAMPYAEYLKTPHWRSMRLKAMTRWNGRCEECGQPARDVHHKTYDRLGHERVSDLTPLCRTCHEAEHPTFDRSSTAGRPIASEPTLEGSSPPE